VVEKCDLCQRYAKRVKSLKEWRGNPPPQRPWSSVSIDFLEIDASEQGHVAILNIQDDLSRSGVFFPVKKMTAAQTAFHLLYDVILKFGKSEIIRSDKVPGIVGEMVAWITEAEYILRRTSAPYHPQSMGLVERANQIIQAKLNKMSFTRRHWDFFLPLTQYCYDFMPLSMFKGLCCFEIVYGYLPGDNPFDQLASSIPQLSGDEIIECAERKRKVLEAM